MTAERDLRGGGGGGSVRLTLAQVMQESGGTCTNSTVAFQNLLIGLDSSAAFTESEIARALAMMARTSSNANSPIPSNVSIWGPSPTAAPSMDKNGAGQVWDSKVFVTVIGALRPNLDWKLVFRSLDVDEFSIGDLRSLDLLVGAHRIVFGMASKFPLENFWGQWKNIRGQISLLKWAAQAPKELLDVCALSHRKILTAEVLGNVNPATRSLATTWLTMPWNSYNFLETLVLLAAIEPADDAKQLLDIASRQATELVLFGLVQMPQPWSPLHADVALKLVTIFLMGHANAGFVLNHIWQTNSNLMLNAMILLHSKDPNLLSRILDVAQELKALNAILDTNHYPLVFDLAALAARREYLNLEKWLQDVIRKNEPDFLRALIEFIRQKLLEKKHVSETQPVLSIPLSEKCLVTMFKALQSNMDTMSSETLSLFQETERLVLEEVPQLRMPPTSATAKTTEQESNVLASEQFPPAVEEESTLYYEKIYNGELSIPQVVELLQRYHTSKKKHEQNVFSCMIHNLFDEYRFFPKYPDKELIVTGELFGALIKNQLILDFPLGVALRYILEALRKPLGSKMFRFGLTALLQIQSRLAEWPQYCSHLMQISHLREAHPEIIRYVENAFAKAAQSTATSEPQILQASTKDASPIQEKPSERVTTESTASFDVPNDAVREKILFIVNNISEENMSAKIPELVKVLKEMHFRWFSNYLVVKRASIEPNFHSVYISLLDTFRNRALTEQILNETYANIRTHLYSEKSLTSSQERTLLKNLGSWLGGLTLAKDLPIKHTDLAMKNLLLDSYHANRLVVTIPFICKVLEQCKSSKVFRPPNPWLMAILRLLVELYLYADLKLNLKFEVEVFCKNTNIELKDIEPSNLLRIQQFPQEDVPGAAHMAMGPAMDMQAAPIVSGGRLINGQSVGMAVMFDEAGNLSIPNLESFVSFNSNPALFNAHPALKKFVLVSIDRAVREIIGPVVERSISIATVATRELILKDFSNEPNEERMRRAAQLMIQNLAGNLATVTSKEPFRISMTTHLRTLLTQNGLNENAVESLVQATVQDNIEVGCLVVEKAAIEKAIPEINEALAHAYIARRRQRERGMPWMEVSQFPNSRYPATLPEALRLQPGNAEQMRFYEEFAHMRPSVDAEGLQADESMAAENPLQQIMDKFTALLNDLDSVIRRNSEETLTSLPPDHEIITIVRQINVSASQFFVRDDLALWFSQKLVGLLYKTEISLGIEIYIILLERICDISKRVAKELMIWLLFSDDERKFNVRITHALIQTGLLNVLELDSYLAKQMETGGSKSVEFATHLIHKCLCEEKPLVTHAEFYFSLDMLAKMEYRKRLPESIAPIVAEIRQVAPGPFAPFVNTEVAALREQCVVLFEVWVRICQNPESDGAEISFFKQMEAMQIVNDVDAFAIFSRSCIEAIVETYRKLKNTPGGGILAYQVVDSFARLVVLLLQRDEGDEKVQRFSRILSIVAMEVVHNHSLRREHFDQKPFFRLLTSVLWEMKRAEKALEPIQSQLILAFGNMLHLLEPNITPGFVFAWLELASHRNFMPHLLLLPDQKGWPLFHKLMIDMFRFLAPFLRHAEMTDPIRVLYKGCLRCLLLLLHDFPEFLCDYHFSFCDIVPPSCIQLRNLVLSAFPRNMRLPDPFTPNLKVDLLPEISESPLVLSDYASILEDAELLAPVDSYLKTRGPAAFLLELNSKLFLSTEDSYLVGTKYHVSLMNALVLHIGVQAIRQMQSKPTPTNIQGNNPVITQSAPMDIFQQLVLDLDSEGRYHFFNAIANQLRFPNAHTHYFSCVLLYLFAEATQEVIQEQITRVLLERLIVNRPHPWGLLITFIELLKNPRYIFWSHGFTRIAPDIERLFESVARSCMLPAEGSGNNAANATAPA